MPLVTGGMLRSGLGANEIFMVLGLLPILAAIAVVVYGTYKVLGNNIATLASGVDSALTSA